MPVSDTGRIWLATVAGHAPVAVDVLGYFTRASTAAATDRTGTWRPVPATVAATTEIPAGGTQNITLPGAPDKGLTGAVLTLNTTGTVAGHIRVTPSGATTRADAVDVVKGTRSATVFTATTDAAVTLKNTAQAPTTVTVRTRRVGHDSATGCRTPAAVVVGSGHVPGCHGEDDHRQGPGHRARGCARRHHQGRPGRPAV